jgi:FkbM family methyltransferase
MISRLKGFIRNTLWLLHLDITQNLRYDRATQKIMRKVLRPESNCIDVGAHKGEILEQILKLSPLGRHLAIEPIPAMAKSLSEKFSGKPCEILRCAVSNFSGKTNFHVVKNAPAYSGLRQRKYATDRPEIETIEVEVNTLDTLWPGDLKLDLIKLDIEGGELHALEGASAIMHRYRPYVIFEFGLGSAEFYESTPAKMFNFFKTAGMCLEVLDHWAENSKGLDRETFIRYFREKSAYYFIGFRCEK